MTAEQEKICLEVREVAEELYELSLSYEEDGLFSGLDVLCDIELKLSQINKKLTEMAFR